MEHVVKLKINKKLLGNLARAKLVAIWERDKGRCRYCNEETIPLRSITASGRAIVFQTANTITWVAEDGRTMCRKLATLDHVLPISCGGRSGKKNLVLCCRACNGKRGEATEELRANGVVNADIIKKAMPKR